MVTMQFLFRLLQQEGIHARHLVVELTPELLAWPDRSLPVDITRFFGPRDILANATEILGSSARSRVLSTRVIPIDHYRTELLEFIVGVRPPAAWVPAAAPAVSGTPPPNQGPWPLQPVPPASWLASRALGAFELSGTVPRAMTALIQETAALGMTVTFVVPPAASNLRELKSAQTWRELDAFIESLSRRPGVAVVRYRSRLADTLFTDVQHTSNEGRRVFSRLLADEVLGPWWIKACAEAAEARPATD